MKMQLAHTFRSLTAAALSFAALSYGTPLRGSDSIPGAPQAGPIALTGGTLHPVSGPPIENGVLLMVEGRIAAVGRKVALPEGTRVIDVTGKHVYPALFDAHTQTGLVEIDAVRATRDMQEVGSLNPNVMAHVAVNPDSELIPVTRANGVLLNLTAPVGGLISGQSAVMQLDGWTYEDMTLQPRAAMQLDWPRMSSVRPWWDDEAEGGEDLEKQRNRQLKELDDFFDAAAEYTRARAAAPEKRTFDARYEAMGPALRGEQPLIVQAEELAQIESAVAFAVRRNLKIILLGGYDASECASLLKKHDIPVIIPAVYQLPMRPDDPYDTPYTLAERLRRAGVTFCIGGGGRFSASNVRNLPYHAATAAAYGLPVEEALRAITLSPAEILGVENRVGSLEAGKHATLFVASGDPLETATQVEQAWIQGREVDLTSRHTRLYRKYEEKQRQLGE